MVPRYAIHDATGLAKMVVTCPEVEAAVHATGGMAYAPATDAATDATHYWPGGVEAVRPVHPAPALTATAGVALPGFPPGWPVRIIDPSGVLAFDGVVPADGEITFGDAGAWRVEVMVKATLGAHMPASWEILVT